MKYLLTFFISFGSLFAPLYAEMSVEMERDVDFIVNAMFFSYSSDKDASITQMITAYAEDVIEAGDKTMEMSVLVEKVKETMSTPEFMRSIYAFLEKDFTPEEVKKIRQMYEDETFIKFQQRMIKLSQLFVLALNQTIQDVIGEYGQLKEQPINIGDPRVMSVTVENFKTEVEQYVGMCIVDVYADWCSPCKRMKPIFEELSAQYTNIKFVKINSDESKEITKRYKVTGLPTFLFIKNGEVVGRQVGFTNADGLKAKITEFFGLSN